MDAPETTILTAVLIASLIIGSIIIYFFISIIGHQRRNQALYKSKIKAEITTLERERARMAADLHDELGPVLSSVKLKLNLLEIPSGEDKQQLEKINTHIDDIMKRMREISNNLMPTTLTRKGLEEAVHEFISRTTKPKNLQIHFKAENFNDLPQEKSIHIYRIVQEIIHNTIKHAGANRLDISIVRKNGNLLLSTTDNGKGFNYHNTQEDSYGQGLRNLLSRSEIMNGEMFIDSRPGKGTKFSFEIPI